MPPEQDPELVPLNPGFDVVWHGFDRAQVYQYIEEVDGNVRLLAADRDAALSQVDELTESLQSARSEIAKLHKRIDDLCKGPHSEQDLDDRLRRMVRLANTQADEIIARAQAAAEHSLAKTEEMSTSLRTRYTKLLSEVDKQREELQVEHKGVMEHTRVEVQRLSKEAQQRQERLDADAEARRKQLADEFEAAMKQQREDLEREVAERQRTSKAEAEKLVRDATEEAERLLSKAQADAEARERQANEEVQRLRTLRGEVLDQVRSAQQVLGRSASLLEPLEQESEGGQPNAAPVPRSEGQQGSTAQDGAAQGGQDGGTDQQAQQQANGTADSADSAKAGGRNAKQSGNNSRQNKARANAR